MRVIYLLSLYGLVLGLHTLSALRVATVPLQNSHKPFRSLERERGEQLHASSSSSSSSSNRFIRKISNMRNSKSKLPSTTGDDLETDKKEEDLSRQYVVLAILLATFVSNQWSRQALFYLCEFTPDADAFRHMNVALDFSKESYAALASFGFTAVFALVSLFSGSVSDRYDRNVIAGISCAVWSIATASQAFATNFQQLIPLRAIVGASQAFYNPVAYTLIADIFPRRVLASVNGIFSGGIYLGGALSSLSIILDYYVGWKTTMLVIGGIGLGLALFGFLFLPEPRSPSYIKKYGTIEENVGTGESTNVIKDIKDIKSKNVKPGLKSILNMKDKGKDKVKGKDKGKGNELIESEGKEKEEKVDFNFVNMMQEGMSAFQECTASYQAKLLYSAAVLRFVAGFSIGIWKAPFIFEKFAGSEIAFSGGNAFILAVGGFSSGLLGGYFSDLLSNPKDPKSIPRGRSWVPAVGSLLAAPLWAAFITAPTPQQAALFLFFEYLVAECWFGPTLAALFDVVPATRRGAAQGLFSLATALGNFGPIAIGSLAANAGVISMIPSDIPGLTSLGATLLAVVGGSYLICAVIFAVVAREEDKDIRRKFLGEIID